MRVSLNWIKKYIDLPKEIDAKQIAYDLTLRTVEVEDVIDTESKFHDIVVGKILEVKNHPNADKLRICITDIGEEKPVQIVCGGSNLYEGEYVVVSKPGAEVVWHGEGEPIKITESKVRGESSYGMICGATEVFLDKLFPPKDEYEIVDLKGIDCKPGDSIAKVTDLGDTVLEIDNKSLTNRPDLWGHYGIARELSAIYHVPLKELPKVTIDKSLPAYDIEIKEPEKCRRYVGIEIENVYDRPSPLWMQALITNCGMRPINALVDITNYVMMAVGQPMHAFDRTHVDGHKIIVRNAKKDEELLLLDDNTISLTEDDLVICDEHDAMALAGIRGGKKDSILPETTGVLLEIANFAASTIRKSGKRFDEKTDSSIRYEKNIDTARIDEGLNLAISLIKEIFPESKIVAYGDNYPVKTERAKIEVPEEFLDVRLGKKLPQKTIEEVLTSLGYDVTYENKVYHVIAPVWRSTGDVSIKDDVMGDIARLLDYQSFEPQPLTISFEHAVRQNKVLLERRLKEYLAYRCGFNEIYTYPWIDIKYINAAKIDMTNAVRLATPPAPELANLRSSLVPGMLEAIAKNLRYNETFKLFEMAQVFEKGIYHESTEDETLPIHKKYLIGASVNKNAKTIFYEIKGVIEAMAKYCHMDSLTLCQKEKPTWADINAYLNITLNDEIIGNLGLVSLATMNDAKIKHTNVAIFELNVDKLNPLPSRTNTFEHLPQVPLVEKDLSILVDEDVTWGKISMFIKKKVHELEFIDEYRGNQVPEGKKSITLRVKIGDGENTLTSDEITEKMNSIIKTLNSQCGAEIREE